MQPALGRRGLLKVEVLDGGVAFVYKRRGYPSGGEYQSAQLEVYVVCFDLYSVPGAVNQASFADLLDVQAVVLRDLPFREQR
jgi:hypothetical protein